MIFTDRIVSVDSWSKLFLGARVAGIFVQQTVRSVNDLFHFVHKNVVLFFDFCQSFLVHKIGLAFYNFALFLRNEDNFVTTAMITCFLLNFLAFLFLENILTTW